MGNCCALPEPLPCSDDHPFYRNGYDAVKQNSDDSPRSRDDDEEEDDDEEDDETGSREEVGDEVDGRGSSAVKEDTFVKNVKKNTAEEISSSVEDEHEEMKVGYLESVDVRRCVNKQPTKWRSGVKYVVVSSDDEGSTKTQGGAAQTCGADDKDAEVIPSGVSVIDTKKSSNDSEAPVNETLCKNETKSRQSINEKGEVSPVPKNEDQVLSFSDTIAQLNGVTENSRAMTNKVRQRAGPSDSLVRPRKESLDSKRSQKSLKAQLSGNDAARVSNLTVLTGKSLSPKCTVNYAAGENVEENDFAVTKTSGVSTSSPRSEVNSLNSQTKERRRKHSDILRSASTSIEYLCERTSSVSRYDGSSDRLTSDKDTTPSKAPNKCEQIKSKIHHRHKIHNETSSTVSNEDFPSKRKSKTDAPAVHDRSKCLSDVNSMVNSKQRQRDDTDDPNYDVNGELLTQLATVKNEISFTEHDTSFKLDSDLEVPVLNSASKSLHELVESFVHDTSIVRRPCREFLDTNLYEEAKALHHRTLLEAVTAARKCSSSCMSSRATSVRTVVEQSTFELRDEGGVSSDGSANPKGPRKVLKFNSLGRTPSISSVKKNKSPSRRCGKGIAKPGDCSLSVELFDLDDYLLSDITCGNNSSTGVATPCTENRGLASAADAASLKSDTSVTPKCATPTKRDSLGTSRLDVPFPSTLERSPRRSGNSPRTLKKDSPSAPLLSGHRQWELKDEESATTKDKKNNSKGRNSLICDGGDFTAKGRSSFSNDTNSFSCDDPYLPDVGNDVSPARGVSLGTIPKNKSSSFRQNSHRGSGSSIQSTGFTLYDDFENISQNDTIFSTPKKTDTIFSTPKKTDRSFSKCDLSMNSRDDVFVAFDEDLGAGCSKLKNNNSPLFKKFTKNEKTNSLSTESSSFIHNKFEDLGDFDSYLNENPKDSHKNNSKKKKNNSNNNFCNGNDSYSNPLNYDDFPPLGGDSPKLNGNSSRLNNSPSTPRSNGTPYNGGFSSLNGSSPTFVKRNNFRFDENPRFDSNTSCDLPLESSPPNFDSSRKHSKTKNDFPTPKNPRRARHDHGTVNDSQEFQPEDLFMYNGLNDDMEDDPFSNSSHGNNGNDGGVNKEEESQQQQEDSSETGPCLSLNNHVKLTNKGVSFGALGCELSVGRKVEINLFGKKATLV